MKKLPLVSGLLGALPVTGQILPTYPSIMDHPVTVFALGFAGGLVFAFLVFIIVFLIRCLINNKEIRAQPNSDHS